MMSREHSLNSENILLRQCTLALLSGQSAVAADPLRPHWHLAPPVGLLNDPNGLVQAHGRYHVFYQWNPLACAHGAKWWGHWSSADLVHWRHEPVALMPTEDYEVSGCYSGSAVVVDDQIHLIYTGNIKYSASTRTAFQCLAIEQPDGSFAKQGPMINLPSGYTGHVRDPKVWQQGDCWYMVLGAQKIGRIARVLLYRSVNLRQWECLGEIAGNQLHGLQDFGYMWECPDLFALDGHDILLCCPQGVDPAYGYPNLYQCGYFAGQLDYETPDFTHGGYHQLDHGFEFYAPQTMALADGRRILIGWMGMPDDNELAQPTVRRGWVNTMTCPRELFWDHDQMYQRPAQELRELRGEELNWMGLAEEAPVLAAVSAELKITVNAPFSLSLRDQAALHWTGEHLVLQRHNWRTGNMEQRVWTGIVFELQILLDASSIEIFINEGATCMSARYFPDESQKTMHFAGTQPIAIHYWPLSACTIA